MKKLLLASKTLGLTTILLSCQTNFGPTVNDEGKFDPPTSASDSTDDQLTVRPIGSVGGDLGLNKDSVPYPDSFTVFRHGAPNQDVIDSIKGSKSKDN